MTISVVIFPKAIFEYIRLFCSFERDRYHYAARQTNIISIRFAMTSYNRSKLIFILKYGGLFFISLNIKSSLSTINIKVYTC
jgi:hypothetical protein